MSTLNSKPICSISSTSPNEHALWKVYNIYIYHVVKRVLWNMWRLPLYFRWGRNIEIYVKWNTHLYRLGTMSFLIINPLKIAAMKVLIFNVYLMLKQPSIKILDWLIISSFLVKYFKRRWLDYNKNL